MGWDGMATARRASDAEVWAYLAPGTGTADERGRVWTQTDRRVTHGGEHFWMVTRIDGAPVYITLYLVQRQETEFMVKGLCELEGPYYYDCPPELLAVCPCPESREAWKWRQGVLTGGRGRPVGPQGLLGNCRG